MGMKRGQFSLRLSDGMRRGLSKIQEKLSQFNLSGTFPDYCNLSQSLACLALVTRLPTTPSHLLHLFLLRINISSSIVE